MTLFPSTTTNNNYNPVQQQSPRNNINNNTSLSSSSSAPARLTTLLAEALEICIHELLYIRNIYPSDAFASYRYLDVRCHGCRHPDVIDYIADVLRVAVPSICSGVADSLALVVIGIGGDDQGREGQGAGGEEIVWERFCFEFDPVEMRRVNCDIEDDNDGDAINAAEGDGDDDDDVEIIDMNNSQRRRRRRRRKENDGDNSTSKRRNEDVAALVKDLEFGLRQLILRIITLEGSRRDQGAVTATRPPNVTFKLCLRTTTTTTTTTAAATTQCDELDNALKEGRWFQPDRESCEFRQQRRRKERQRENEADNDDLSLSSLPSNIVVTRPLKSLCVPSCGIRMQLLMEVKSDDGV